MMHGATWEGKDIVLMNEWEEGGKKLVFKEVFSDITSTCFTQTLYQGNPPICSPSSQFALQEQKRQLLPTSHDTR